MLAGKKEAVAAAMRLRGRRGAARCGAMALAGLLAVGCAGAPRTIAGSFRPGAPLAPQPRMEVLVVHRPDNARVMAAESRTAGGLWFLVPLVPYGTQHITPETHMRMIERQPYDLLDDLGRAVTADLAASGVARRVAYNAEEAGGQRGPHLYLTVREGEWERHVTTYGLSLGGCVLWFLGAPVSYGQITLSVEADLRDSSGKQIGRKVFTAHVPYTNYVYAPHGLTDRLPSTYVRMSSALRTFLADSTKHL